MLKHLKFSGIFHDSHLSVSVTLENPKDYGLEATKLVFSVALRSKDGEIQRFEDFTFYVMDETCRLYNTQSISPHATEINQCDNEPVRHQDGLIYTNFKHDFMFQDLRIAFGCRIYRRLNIIELKH